MSTKDLLELKFDKDEPEAGEIFVSGVVDHVPVKFFIDTGATHTSVVDVKSIEDYPSTRTVTFKGIGGNSQTGEYVEVSKLQVGSQLFAKSEILRVKEGGNRKSTVGIDLLNNKIFSFDLIKKRINFLENLPKSIHYDNCFKGKKGHIYLHSFINTSKTPILSLWDTGAGLSLVDQKVINEYPENFTFIKKTAGDDTTGSSFTLDLYRMNHIKVGHLEFRDITVLAADLTGMRNSIGDDVYILLGFNIIINHKWCFDLKRMLWMVL